MDACIVDPLHAANLEELQAEAGRFSRSLVPSAAHATLVTLSGELGAGKTSYTQGLAHAFGIEEPVTSPTFVLEKIYDLPAGKRFARIAHIDAYRLEGEKSLAPLGFGDLYADPATLIIVEWPELIANQLPKPDVSVTLSVSGNGRDISYA